MIEPIIGVTRMTNTAFIDALYRHHRAASEFASSSLAWDCVRGPVVCAHAVHASCFPCESPHDALEPFCTALTPSMSLPTTSTVVWSFVC
eukprot:5529134-Pleurochrysis_carterae.AAC.1